MRVLQDIAELIAKRDELVAAINAGYVSEVFAAEVDALNKQIKSYRLDVLR